MLSLNKVEIDGFNINKMLYGNLIISYGNSFGLSVYTNREKQLKKQWLL